MAAEVSKRTKKALGEKFEIHSDLFVRDKKTYVIIGAAIEVHKELGCGVFKATGLRVGLLINFEAKSLEYKRFIYTNKSV